MLLLSYTQLGGGGGLMTMAIPLMKFVDVNWRNVHTCGSRTLIVWISLICSSAGRIVVSG